MDHPGQAKKVRLHHGADFALFAFLNGAHVAKPGVVHQHVDAAEGRFGPLYGLCYFRLVRDVQLQGQRAALVASFQVLNFARVARRDDRAIAAIKHELGELPAEAGGASGDEPDI